MAQISSPAVPWTAVGPLGRGRRLKGVRLPALLLASQRVEDKLDPR